MSDETTEKPWVEATADGGLLLRLKTSAGDAADIVFDATQRLSLVRVAWVGMDVTVENVVPLADVRQREADLRWAFAGELQKAWSVVEEARAEAEQRPDVRIASALDRLASAFREMRAPVVNVPAQVAPTVNVVVPERKPRVQRINRDRDGLIESVTEEPAS